MMLPKRKHPAPGGAFSRRLTIFPVSAFRRGGEFCFGGMKKPTAGKGDGLLWFLLKRLGVARYKANARKEKEFLHKILMISLSRIYQNLIEDLFAKCYNNKKYGFECWQMTLSVLKYMLKICTMGWCCGRFNICSSHWAAWNFFFLWGFDDW